MPKLKPSKINIKVWVLILLALFASLYFIVINPLYFLRSNNDSLKTNTTSARLKEIEHNLNASIEILIVLAANLRHLKDNLAEINSSLKNQNKKIELLNDDDDVKSVAIENLIKAKNTLFERINSLEIELHNLKNKEIPEKP